jgi:hypothetical protein
VRKKKIIDNQITKFLKIAGIINNIFKPNKVQRGTRIKLNNTLAVPVLHMTVKLDSKIKDKSRLTAWKCAKDCKIYMEGSQN